MLVWRRGPGCFEAPERRTSGTRSGSSPTPNANEDFGSACGTGTTRRDYRVASQNTDARHLHCPRCLSDRTVHWGAAHGVPRYRCKSCRHTFNLLTNTPLARLRYKKRWLTYVGTMVERKSVRKSAAACGVSATTSFRWHQRFLSCSVDQRVKILSAIAGAYSNAPALTGLSENAATAELSWCRELLPVILSWIL